ncbi:MAG: hypothetical protein GC158_17230 [Cyanobacteria bacterium RI_101]|nr:hypothetical protein [Cyanobacteria bacterium RI_101]
MSANTPQKLGSTILVNTSTPSGNGGTPSIGAFVDGRFVVAWSDSSESGGDISSGAIRAQFFNANGTRLGSEFLVNTTTINNQLDPSVAVLKNGRFVVTWTDFSFTGGDTFAEGIRGQIFNADGSRFGNEFLVNTTTAFPQNQSTVTALADGGFVVAWSDISFTQDDSGYGVRARVFNANGAPLGNDFQANVTTASDQRNPAVAALPSGGFAMVWRDDSPRAGDPFGDLTGRIFTQSNGTYGGGQEFDINTTATNIQSQPAIAVLTNGRFVVAWTDGSLSADDPSLAAVRAQMFNANGTRFGGEFLVNTTLTDSQQEPTITALPDGGFVIAFIDNSLKNASAPTIDSAIRGQRFDGNGNRVGHEFLLSDPNAFYAFAPTITSLSDGTLVASWYDLANIRAQRFSLTNDSSFTGTVGNDALNGTTGADTLIGLAGNDTYTVNNSGDAVVENPNEGTDTVKSDITYTLPDNVEKLTLNGSANLNGTGNALNNTLTGNSGNNALTGLAGNDALDGKAGADSMIGGLGNDTYTVDNIGDVITENANEGTDSVKASINYTLGANLENLTLTGSANLNGTGNSLNNKLTGNTGANLLNGGAGADTLAGKDGNDVFVFRFGESTVTALDRITDFAIGADKIDLLTQGGAALNKPAGFTRAADSATTNINTIVTNVFADANGAQAGNQALGLNRAALVKANTATYLIVNDGTAGFQSANDLVINLTGITGTLPALGTIPVGNFFV